MAGDGANPATWLGEDDMMNVDFSGLGFRAGQIGGAAQLAGLDNQFFSVGNIAEIANTFVVDELGNTEPVGTGFSISAWVNVDPALTGRGTVFFSRDSIDTTTNNVAQQNTSQVYGIDLANQGNGVFIDGRASGQGVGTAEGSVAIAEWQHVVMSFGIDASDDFAVTNSI